MSDITKCYGKDCLVKENCHRFTAKDNEHQQSYDDFKWNTREMRCTMYICNRNRV